MRKNLGRLIRMGARDAVESYYDINKFHGALTHASQNALLYIPELYLQAHIAARLSGARHRIFVERSLSGILGLDCDSAIRDKGRIRPDICIADVLLEAFSFIEIKRVVSRDEKIDEDICKIEMYGDLMKRADKRAVSGYVFVYTEGCGESSNKDMLDRLMTWGGKAGRAGWRIILSKTQIEPRHENWCWGYAIFKYDYVQH
ncbi:hypothetical protein [Methylosinus sp. RM1]|uniref:hypothetical protein n=1 Tax=Methylosinus sp. RM1 TaxID=2583817 RepID=UPI001407C766|nr:hypothetical protein [Methylosinus sp. RM1]